MVYNFSLMRKPHYYRRAAKDVSAAAGGVSATHAAVAGAGAGHDRAAGGAGGSVAHVVHALHGVGGVIQAAIREGASGLRVAVGRLAGAVARCRVRLKAVLRRSALVHHASRSVVPAARAVVED